MCVNDLTFPLMLFDIMYYSHCLISQVYVLRRRRICVCMQLGFNKFVLLLLRE
jgi:hypothetical protein